MDNSIRGQAESLSEDLGRLLSNGKVVELEVPGQSVLSDHFQQQLTFDLLHGIEKNLCSLL